MATKKNDPVPTPALEPAPVDAPVDPAKKPVLAGYRTYASVAALAVPLASYALSRLHWLPAGSAQDIVAWMSTPEAFAIFVATFGPVIAWFRARVDKPALPPLPTKSK